MREFIDHDSPFDQCGWSHLNWQEQKMAPTTLVKFATTKSKMRFICASHMLTAMQHSLLLLTLVAAASAFSPPAALPSSPWYAANLRPPLPLTDKRGHESAGHTWTLALAADRRICSLVLNVHPRCCSGMCTTMLRRSHPLRLAPKRSLQLRMVVGGPNRKDVATSCFAQAVALQSQGKYEYALELYTKSLDIWIQEYGPDHNCVADSYNNIAAIYNAQGKYEDALELFEKSLDIDIKVHGPDHPDVATLYINLASVHNSQVCCIGQARGRGTRTRDACQ